MFSCTSAVIYIFLLSSSDIRNTRGRLHPSSQWIALVFLKSHQKCVKDTANKPSTVTSITLSHRMPKNVLNKTFTMKMTLRLRIAFNESQRRRRLTDYQHSSRRSSMANVLIKSDCISRITKEYFHY